MTYSVPDPASESPDPIAGGPATPTPSAVVGPDGSGIEQAPMTIRRCRPGTPSRQVIFRLRMPPPDADDALPRHAAPEGFDAPAADVPPPPQAQVADVAEAPAAPMATRTPWPIAPSRRSVGDDLGNTADEPLRVAHEDSEDYEKFVTDPEAAEEATRARIDAQAEAEKAAAGITPATEELLTLDSAAVVGAPWRGDDTRP